MQLFANMKRSVGKSRLVDWLTGWSSAILNDRQLRLRLMLLPFLDEQLVAQKQPKSLFVKLVVLAWTFEQQEHLPVARIAVSHVKSPGLVRFFFISFLLYYQASFRQRPSLPILTYRNRGRMIIISLLKRRFTYSVRTRT